MKDVTSQETQNAKKTQTDGCWRESSAREAQYGDFKTPPPAAQFSKQ
jgi:hypothetical protein